jgi:hypothetical protein
MMMDNLNNRYESDDLGTDRPKQINQFQFWIGSLALYYPNIFLLLVFLIFIVLIILVSKIGKKIFSKKLFSKKLFSSKNSNKNDENDF